MLFVYKDKVYVRPFANKMIEVIITKKGSEYDIQPTNNKLEITTKIDNNLYSITVEQAYALQHKSSVKEESSLKSKKIFKD